MPQKKLTSKFVENVKPPTKRTTIDYFDTHLPGFGLRVTSSGSKS